MNTVYLVANGDLRLSANQKCEPAQAAMEKALVGAIEREGFNVKRAHLFDETKGHGFIDSQKMGLEVFKSIPQDAPLVVAEAVWQYSQHLLGGLISHRGPILTFANWSGTWPGLVGLLNLNGSLTKAGVKYSTLWSEEFSDPLFMGQLRTWFAEGFIRHKTDHVTPLAHVKVPAAEERLGQALAAELLRDKAILGVFDEGCMGMFNAIVPDHLLNPTGVYKERLSQSALYFESQQVRDDEARGGRRGV